MAGTSLILSPHMTIAMTEQSVLSPTGLLYYAGRCALLIDAIGSCKTFSDDADGYARGEAVSAI